MFLHDLFYKKPDHFLKDVFCSVMNDKLDPWTIKADLMNSVLEKLQLKSILQTWPLQTFLIRKII